MASVVHAVLAHSFHVFGFGLTRIKLVSHESFQLVLLGLVARECYAALVLPEVIRWRVTYVLETKVYIQVARRVPLVRIR